jgi:AcrR family transcriptional regulator
MSKGPKAPEIARRTPRQSRSVATVDAILDATAQILVKSGHHALSMRAVANRAGVSIGSLYQYFASKAALIRGLDERFRQRIFTDMASDVAASEGQALEERIERLIAILVRHKCSAPALAARLTVARTDLDGPGYFMNESPFVPLVQAGLAQHGVGDAEEPLVPFLVVQTIEGVFAGLSVTPALMEHPRLTRGITQMIVSLLDQRT